MNFRTTVLSLAVAIAFAGAAPVTPPTTSKAANPMTEADVRALLTTQGYSGINDVEFKDGTWTADGKSV